MAKRLPGRSYDRFFFTGMAILILFVVAVGFAPTYYLDGIFRAPLPNAIIQVHAAVFSSWILLLLVQNGLIAARRVTLHRTLGLAGFCLAILVVICGLLAMASQLHFRASRGVGMLTFSIISLHGMLIFGVMAALSYAARTRNLAAHKRFILLATFGLIDAALYRWPWSFIHHSFYHDFFVVDMFVLLLAVYDLWSTHRIHRATWTGALFIIAMEQLAIPIGSTPAWHAVARWIQTWNL